MKKVIFILTIVLTFGIFLFVPKTYAYSWTSPNIIKQNNFPTTSSYYYSFDNVNEYMRYYRTTTGSASNVNYYAIDNLNVLNNNNYILKFFIFGTKLGNFNLRLGTDNISYNSGSVITTINSSMTGYTENNPLVIDYSFTANTSRNYYINLNRSSSNYDYDFNMRIVFINTTTSGINDTLKYIPYGTFYNGYTGITNNVGAFQNAKVELVSGNDYTDVTEETLIYNTLTLTNLVDTICSINDVNSNTSLQYELLVTFPNQPISTLVGLQCSYMEIKEMQINGTWYTYQMAKDNFSYIGTNTNLYSNDSYIFGPDTITSDYVGQIWFRLSDYSFKSSSYYNSTIGTRGYLANSTIVFGGIDSTNIYNNAYNNGYEDGSTSGYDSGYTRGYNDGANSNKGGFDNLMFAIGNVPITIIDGVLNFEILGFNLKGVFLGIITLLLFVFLIRRFKE